LRDIAYLNTAMFGPVPQAAVDASSVQLEAAVAHGYPGSIWARSDDDVWARQRLAYAERLGARPQDVALTTSTSEGVVRVVAGMDLGPDDEVLTSDEEHPGLLGPLADLRRRRGVRVRAVPLAGIADAVGPATRLVACSHVSWVNGSLAPKELREVAKEVAVLLDGAQGIGAVDVDVVQLGVAFYAGSGQKWLCGPMGTGMLYVRPDWQERLEPIGSTYFNQLDSHIGLDAVPYPDARRHDASALSPETAAFAVAAHDVVVAAGGWGAAQQYAASLAQSLADALRERGRDVAPRDRTTLVSWHEEDPAAFVQRADARGVALRHVPDRPLVRASVGPWNDTSDLERVLELLP
jgi:L-cysteine/cystine lyase